VTEASGDTGHIYWGGGRAEEGGVSRLGLQTEFFKILSVLEKNIWPFVSRLHLPLLWLSSWKIAA